MATRKTTKAQTKTTAPSTPTAKSYLPITMRGLHDYSYWWAYAREHAKATKPNTKEFRRGRIWT